MCYVYHPASNDSKGLGGREIEGFAVLRKQKILSPVLAVRQRENLESTSNP